LTGGVAPAAGIVGRGWVASAVVAVPMLDLDKGGFDGTVSYCQLEARACDDSWKGMTGSRKGQKGEGLTDSPMASRGPDRHLQAGP
jgi:hypothetical protein